MRSFFALSALAATCLSSAIPASEGGLVFPTEELFDKRADGDRTRPGACTNGPNSRQCWGQYDINTDYYNVVPNTGVTREYWLVLTNTTLAPDGVPRNVLTVNGTIPGPLIWANWGDNLIIHVQNNLKDNGTSIHWHGVQQNRTNQNDGVNSITQCPTPPGGSYTYKWRATNYGSSWYHSHYSLQAWEGVQGPIIIYGPATANYDVDKGTIMLNDWTHVTVDALYAKEAFNGPQLLDNGLINGTNTYNNTVGKRFTTSVTSGQRYLLRLVNGAIDTHFKFSIDNHTMTVIANDFVPIKPFNSTFITIGMGERYDVIVTANQPSNQNYWIRAVPQDECSDNASRDNIKGILKYTTSTADPTTTGYNLPDDCNDFPMASLVPWVSKTVGNSNTKNLSVGLYNSNAGFKWTIGGTSMMANYSDPTLLELQNNRQKTNWPVPYNVVSLPTANQWNYFVIATDSTAPQVAHPIHLHGHDFYVLAQAKGNFTASTPLQTNNPPRRDVAMLPANGYLVVGFITDNPGAWLMHCHIGWHVATGFDVQFVERQSEITIDSAALNQQCSGWNAYVKSTNFVITDSGV